jgi:diguanylate cyclase (GGDEF)-like protein
MLRNGERLRMTIVRDVRDRHAAQARIHHLALHDLLTGLPNRNLFLDRLSHALAQARRRQASVAVLFLDLDQFKLVNDSLGHEVGDEVLRVLSARLREHALDADRVGRIGGNEFLLVLDGPGEGRDDPRVAALLAALRGPIDALDSLHYLSISAGIARYPEHGATADLLFKNAGLATHEAKRRGHDQRVEYSPDFERAVQDRQRLVSRLHEALERGEFELHFQPQFCTRLRRPVGIEALVRWRHPERGLVPPGEFIPVCEESGLIVPLGRWVLREACRHHRRLVAAGRGDLTIAVNVSAMQFLSGELALDVPALLREFDVPAGVLELELTESLVMENPESVIEVMRELRQHGVLLSIDDFGTGYSSMAYLHRLPLDKLKIDKSFITRVEHEGHNAAICESILALARSFDLKVIAEGVETDPQLGWLREHGCDEVQGYLLARPMPFEAMLGHLDAVAPIAAPLAANG